MYLPPGRQEAILRTTSITISMGEKNMFEHKATAIANVICIIGIAGLILVNF